MNEEIKVTINSYLTFMLGEELFASNVNKILNILEMVKITKVPRAPEYMKGVINLRGTVLPVIDTRIKFNLPPIEYTKNTCILVLTVDIDGELINVGALVDSVQEVVEVDDNNILPPPSIGAKYKSKFIEGMIKRDDQFIMLLNLDKVFSSEEVVAMQESTNTTGSEEINLI
jgi:purine-binding chemotaxis protein CheW